MHIETLRLKNFKSFRDAQMSDIPGYVVVVGANGAGKTTLFDVFGFLRDCLTFNVRQALQRRGGFHEVISRGSPPNSMIEIEIQFRMEIAEVGRLVTYLVKIALEKHEPVVAKEILRYKRGRSGRPFHFLDFKRGTGYGISNEEDFSKADIDLEKEQQSVEKDVLAIKGLGQFHRFKAANAFRQLIENWHVSDFHISEARGSKDAAGDSRHLSVSGDNLQLVTQHIKESHPDIFEKIIKAMRHRIPGIKDIKPIITQDGRLLLSLEEEHFDEPFIDKHVSDGTIKMLAYLLLLHDPTPHKLLCVEEPENQLYPLLLMELAEEFEAYARRGGQVFVSTHSPDFLNAVSLDSVFCLFKKDGYTQIDRAREDEQVKAFMDSGDQMGHLWKQSLLPGTRL